METRTRTINETKVFILMLRATISRNHYDALREACFGYTKESVKKHYKDNLLEKPRKTKLGVTMFKEGSGMDFFYPCDDPELITARTRFGDGLVECWANEEQLEKLKRITKEVL